MATLTSKTPANTYKDLLKIASTSDNLGITNSLLVVEDGDATHSSLSLSTGAAKITGDLEVTGNLTVSGTTTTIDSTTIAVKTAFVFEGATADAYETTLQVTDPTADRTLTLPNATGTIALIENKLSVFAATTSSELLGVISDETGTGSLVFATLPTFGATGVKFSGSTSGTTTVLSGATAGTSELTLPVATDTLVGKATTDTLTNKTLTSPKFNENVALTSTSTQLNYVNGVTSAIQTQIDFKAPLASPTFTGTVTVPTPTNATDAVTKGYTDAIKAGLDIKDSVRVASTANIAISIDLINNETIDGVVVATGDRVLLKNQTTGTQNGIYVVVASAAASRSTDADSSAEVTSGMYVFVSEGTVSADMGYVLTTNDPITLGTTSLAFTQFSGAGQIVAGTGISKSANTLSIDTTVVPVKTDNLSVFASTTSSQLAGVISDETGTGALVFASSPTLVTPNLGTPSTLIGTNITGTATSFTSSNVTTNANLTGHITSSGNAAILGSFTVAQLSTAISDEDLSGTNTGDNATNSQYSGLVSNANHSGDATGSTALTLATVNTNAGAFTNASVTVNGKGLVTAASSGTAPVTSVTGTSPIVSSGGLTPAISIGAASASVSGALSNTDWSTFNGKGNGSVTSVGMTVPTGLTITGSPITTSGTLALSLTSTYFIPTTTTLSGTNTGDNAGVTSVTGTSPIVSSGGTTPAISIAAASASASGALSNTDWSTFNSKGNGSVTSVSVTTANGVSGTVATSTTTPAITVSLGSITPSAVQVSGLTASQILSTDASKNLTSLAVATYPSLTELSYVKGVTSAIQTQINAKGAGTVTSVTGTSPIVSSGGTTPAISIAAASASTSGALLNTDWSTFNSKGSGTVTSVATTGTVSGITLTGGTITSTGTITLGGTLSLTSGNVTTALGYTPVSNAGGTITGSLTVTGSLYKYIISPATYGASYNTVLGARASAQGILQLGNNGENTIVGGNTNTGGYLTFYVNSNSDFVTSTNGSLALTIAANTNATFQGQIVASNLSGTNTGDNAGVTSIAVTSPISITGTTTPTISMVAATTLLNGHLTATDWNTFNNKGSGTITSVTGTAPVTSSGGTTPAISMAAATTSVNGYLTSANWTTFNAKASVSYSTFTPTIFSYAGTTNSVTYTLQYGKYIKVDKFVYFTLRITYTALSMTGGYVAFGGLPFTISTSSSRQTVSFGSFDNYLSGDLTKHIGSYLIGGLNQIFYSSYLGLAVTWASGVIPSSSTIDITGMYEATT